MPQDIPSLLVSFADWLFETDIFNPKKVDCHPMPCDGKDNALKDLGPSYRDIRAVYINTKKDRNQFPINGSCPLP